MRVAYIVNQYPKVSHSFIRREIQALERRGMVVQRIAMRGWDGTLAADEDKYERERTQYVLKDGLTTLAFASMRVLLSSPVRFLSALRLAIFMGRRADRPMPYHLAYLAQACRILAWLKA